MKRPATIDTSAARIADGFLALLGDDAARRALLACSAALSLDDATACRAVELVARPNRGNGRSAALVEQIKELGCVRRQWHGSWFVARDVRAYLLGRLRRELAPELLAELHGLLADAAVKRFTALSPAGQITGGRARAAQIEASYQELLAGHRAGGERLVEVWHGARGGDAEAAVLRAVEALAPDLESQLAQLGDEVIFLRAMAAYQRHDRGAAERDFRALWDGGREAFCQAIVARLFGRLVEGRGPAESRRRVAEELEQLLAIDGVELLLGNVLYARPLPEADLAGAPAICEAVGAARLGQLCRRLRRRQPEIAEVWRSWQAIARGALGEEEYRSWQAAATRLGLFRQLVSHRAGAGTVQSFFVTAATRPEVRALPDFRRVLQQWIRPFVEQRRPDEAAGLGAERGGRKRGHKRRKGRKGRRPRIDRRAAFEAVKQQKQAITAAMQGQDFHRARKYVEQLIEYQRQHGGSQFAAKSLCDLAMIAQELGNSEFQLELTARSVRLQPDDGWAWTQHGAALLRSHREQEALEAYDTAERWGEPVVARNGRAEVLRDLGRLDAALLAYEETIAGHPQDVVARNGRAEVLKDLGRLAEALLVYDETIAGHPQNVVARTGRAEVLKDLGRLDEALLTYDETIAGHPQNVVARNGRAEVLKDLGRLDAALSAYEETITRHPQNVVARTGRAEVLKDLGRLDAALLAYDETIAGHPQNVVARSGRAEVLKDLGRLDAALLAYDETIASHPQDVVARNGRAEVLRELGRLDEALLAYEQTLREYPQDAVTRNAYACTLAAAGQWRKALTVLPDPPPITPQDWIAYHIRGMIHLRRAEIDQAITIFQHGVDEDPRPAHREFFRVALAAALLRGDHPERAGDLLAETPSRELELPARLLRTQAAGQAGDLELAAELCAELPEEPPAEISALQGELRRRWIEGREPEHDNTWLFEQLILAVLVAVHYSALRGARRVL